jgi:hypothetical protein
MRIYPLNRVCTLSVEPLANISGASEGDLLVVIGVAELLAYIHDIFTADSYLCKHTVKKKCNTFKYAGTVYSSQCYDVTMKLTTLRTPAGTPASCASTHSARADMGVSSAGLIVAVQPAAKAGPSLRVIIAEGKFHGVTKAAGPTG